MLGGKGGRTSATAAIKAINNFYQPLQTRYEAEHADDIVHRPKLPLKRDNTVNMTQMRELLKDMGKTGACECCKAEKATKFCCHESRRSQCDFFDLFSECEEESEEETEEETEEQEITAPETEVQETTAAETTVATTVVATTESEIAATE
ncbi:hypothetical protein N7523_001206 [Penicillium sp. IBT 18751x]|nr:hypothetical protein N7523_005446 [Penicillium sp. IBT 18751x]KAJ6131500.1 hypothetical protein N7523_001206 [Penicillium sp. IBT 18751x]